MLPSAGLPSMEFTMGYNTTAPVGARRVSMMSIVTGEEASANVFACSVLLGTTMMVAYISKKYRWIYFPESSAALVLGMVFGLFSLGFKQQMAFTFEPEIFFYGLLPIIIFNAGYGLKKRDFFRNFATIVLFAVVGTVISSLVYGLLTYLLYQQGYISQMVSASPLLECLMFGSLISAIDPVATLSIFQDVEAPTLLYNVVFGESLVNDASSIVLFRTFESFLDEEFSLITIFQAIFRFFLISFGSIALGVMVSLLGALALRFVEVRTEFAKFELSLILVTAYVSYSVAELLSLSGIMALFFCGICNAHYSYYSTTHAAKISSKYAFEALAFMSEMFVFAYLGMQVVVARHSFDLGLILSALPLCFLARAANIYPLAWVANRSRTKKIPPNMIFAMWFSGLRGAIAFALSVNMPTQNPAIETCTLFVCIVTTLGMGGSTAPLLSCLGLASGHAEAEEKLDIEILRRASGRDEYNASNTEMHHFHKSFKYIDSKFLKPLFGGQLDVIAETSMARSSGLLDKIGELVLYRGDGFCLKVPSEWVPMPASVSLLGFGSTVKDTLGVPEAEVDVLRFLQSSTAHDGDPAGFLFANWTSLCPELSPPTAQPKEVNMKRSPSLRAASLLSSPSRRSYSGIPSSDPAASSSPLPPSDSFTKHAAATGVRSVSMARPGTGGGAQGGQGVSTGSMPIAARKKQMMRVDSTNQPPAVGFSGRVVPAFVMHCDFSEGECADDMFRYEVVSHPEDLGSSRSLVRHMFLACWRDGPYVAVCRVKANESFLVDGGIMPLNDILESFCTEPEPNPGLAMG